MGSSAGPAAARFGEGLLRLRAARLGAALAVSSAASLFLGYGLLAEPYNADEGAWMREAVDCWAALRQGDFSGPVWSRPNLLYGSASPTLPKLVMGLGMELSGYGPESVPEFRTSGSLAPDEGPLRAARVTSVLVAGAGIGVFHLFLSAAFGSRVALIGAALLAASPLWVRASRMAMTDVYGVGFMLAAVAAFAAWRRRDPARLAPGSFARLVLAGVVLGLAVGSKFSAAGAAFGLGALVLFDGLLKTARPGGGSASPAGSAVRALVLTTAALGAFVATYPHLWPDPVGRMSGVLAQWRDVQELRATHRLGAFRGSFAPGTQSFVALGQALLVPGTATGLAALAAVVVAIALRLRRVPADPDARRLVAWSLVLPAAGLALWAQGHTAQSWILWLALAGAASAAAACGTGDGWRTPNDAAAALVAATAGSLVFILATTYVAWGRYYLPLVPACAVLGALAWRDLGESVGRRGGKRAAALLNASLVAALAGIVVSAPRSSNERIGLISQSGFDRPAGVLYLIGGVALAAALLAAARRRGRPS
jgi:4-amino-4-deoxy-L-arabinose transferase-like glycosyltransferase